MHYNVRNITISGGEVMLTVADSGSGNRGFYRGTLVGFEERGTHAKLTEIGRMLYCGDLQFVKTARCKAKDVYDRCKRRHGTLRSHYHDRSYKKYRERFASEFARRMCA